MLPYATTTSPFLAACCFFFDFASTLSLHSFAFAIGAVSPPEPYAPPRAEPRVASTHLTACTLPDCSQQQCCCSRTGPLGSRFPRLFAQLFLASPQQHLATKWAESNPDIKQRPGHADMWWG